MERLNKFLPMKFYSCSLELFTLQIQIIYRLGCRLRISITAFFSDLDS